MKANTHKTASINTVPALVKRKGQYKAERNRKIFDYRAQGLSFRDIAKLPDINLSHQRVTDIYHDHKKYYEEVKA